MIDDYTSPVLQPVVSTTTLALAELQSPKIKKIENPLALEPGNGKLTPIFSQGESSPHGGYIVVNSGYIVDDTGIVIYVPSGFTKDGLLEAMDHRNQ